MNMPPPNWPPVAAPRSTTTQSPKMAAAVLVGALIAAVGALLPWVSMQSVFGSADVAGTEGDGKIVLVLAALVGAAALVMLSGRDMSPWLPAAVAAAGVAMMAYEWSHVTDVTSSASSGLLRASVGIGVYVSLGGFGLALVASVLAARSPEP